MSLIPFMDLSGDFVTIDVGEKKNQKIKIVGTYEDPYFCGKDVCEILEYKDIKVALQDHVKDKHKKALRLLSNEVGGILPPTSLGLNNLKNLTYHSGKAVYISEAGVLDLVSASRLRNAQQLKLFFDQLFYSMRYNSDICDIFTFIKTRKLNIDVISPWFP